MDNLISIEINKGINLHILNTAKFKTTTLCVYIHNNLDNLASFNALFPSVLRSGSRNFTTSTVISEYLENMYGGVFETDIIKKGEIQSIMFYTGFISNRYAQGEDVLSKAVDLVSDIIFNPVIENGGFKTEFLNIEKNNLKEKIASRINDKAHYAVEKCMEVMCEDEPFSIYKYGSIECVDSIREKDLFYHYKKALSSSPIDIYLAGDIGEYDAVSLFKNKFDIIRENTLKLRGFNIQNSKGDTKHVTKNMDVGQGKLCLGYRTGIAFNDKSYPALAVYTNILGGGMHSKLFLNVREKESMAYYAYSALEKFKGLMIISCGIEIDKYDSALELIGKQVDDMKKGSITDYELESSIKKLRSDLKSVSDNVLLMIDYDMGGRLYGQSIRVEDIIEQIEQVDRNKIVEVAENINLDTVFFIKSHEKQ